MDDEGIEFCIDEIDMQDIINEWSKTYAPDIRVTHWYYDCRQATVLVRLEWDKETE